MLYRTLYARVFFLLSLLLTGCGGVSDEVSSGEISDKDTPVVKAEPSYAVVKEQDITYATGLSHDETSTTSFAVPLKLDVYYPDNEATSRPVFMFIHGGGFTGGVKDGPEMVEMANYYASRGWVFVSVDYRTTEELCNAKVSASCKEKVQDMLKNDAMSGTNEVVTFYKGIAPKEWIEHAMPLIETPKDLQVTIAMYAAQRDAKAALRWIMANSETYNINSDYVTVGGNSAGAGTAIALGISNPADFRDEISNIDDATLSTTNLDQSYDVKSIVHFWGSNGKLDFFEGVYDLELYDRYDENDPELFMGHGEGEDPQTPYTEALELQNIYNSLGVYSELKTLMVPSESDPSVLVPGGHGAWNGEVDGKGLFEMSFDFLAARQQLILE